MPLAPSCSGCVFLDRAEKHRCRRHSPGTTEEKTDVTAYWPIIGNPDENRCGVGAAPGSATVDGVEVGLVPCVACVHWFQPNGSAVEPKYTGWRGPEWWAESGYCTRAAPSPSPEKERRPTRWFATHGRQDGCGDGVLVPED